MSVNYSPWFKKDFWTFKEAACLFSNQDATPEVIDILFNKLRKGNLANNLTLNIHEIFKRADWSTFGNADSEKRKHEEFFEMADKKDIKVPSQLHL